ncbi:hypothetical protein [uncultured Clostridium sp.]|jgi:hypothetical protein|uniref:hypothetical protein n=1 Tax=uncultured Clostridium sp. TaxID=59620 RepID=UPI002584F6DA|nr:hypothetical protein [uncultured Clostridium sp.]
MKKIGRKIKTIVQSIIIGASLVLAGNVPAHAAGMEALEIEGMDGVATSLQNFIKYLGLFFLAGGAVTAFFGAYKLFQSIKNQDGDSRNMAILELASGLGGIAIGFAGAKFSGYIHL